MLGGLGEVLGVMLAPKMAAKSGKYRKKYGSKRLAVPEWFFDGFCVEDKSSPGDINSLKYIGKVVVFRLSAVLA